MRVTIANFCNIRLVRAVARARKNRQRGNCEKIAKSNFAITLDGILEILSRGGQTSARKVHDVRTETGLIQFCRSFSNSWRVFSSSLPYFSHFQLLEVCNTKVSLILQERVFLRKGKKIRKLAVASSARNHCAPWKPGHMSLFHFHRNSHQRHFAH